MSSLEKDDAGKVFKGCCRRGSFVIGISLAAITLVVRSMA
jgi:hypothetical protein